jgi:hypothetical protein
MATVCVDLEAKTHLKGEVVPIAVEVLSNDETEFLIRDDGGVRTFCEVKASSGELIEKITPRVQIVAENHKQLYVAWDTSKYEPGYYIVRFWISINISGASDNQGYFLEDYRLVSPDLNRYIKSDA